MSNVRERLAKSVHFRLDWTGWGPGTSRSCARTIRRNAGDKKAFLHIIRAGEYEAVIALPGLHRRFPVPRPGAGASKARFGYDVLRLHG